MEEQAKLVWFQRIIDMPYRSVHREQHQQDISTALAL